MKKASEATRSQAIIRYPILRLLFVLLSFLLGTMTCNTTSATNLVSEKSENSMPVLLILGDSLSAAMGIKVELGWVHLLEQKLAANGYHYRVVNASISGLPTPDGLAQLPALLAQHKPALLLIELGANDGLRGFPIPMLQENLTAMVQLGKKAGASVLLIGVQIPLNYGPQYTAQFDKVFVTVRKANQISLAPSLLGNVPLDPNLMQLDGLHPNASAQPHLLNNVWPHLQPLLKK